MIAVLLGRDPIQSVNNFLALPLMTPWVTSLLPDLHFKP